MTAAAERIKNGPCKWHKKGICDWKDTVIWNHSAVAMAKLPAVPPRPPPRSVRNATAVSEKDELISLLLQQEQRMEQLEGKLILLFRSRVQHAGVRAASVQPMIPRPTSYLAAAKSGMIPRTKREHQRTCQHYESLWR